MSHSIRKLLIVACSVYHLQLCCDAKATNEYSRDFFCENVEKLCEDLPKHHSGCGSGKWADHCGTERSVVDMTDELKSFILDLHNTARSKIARGKLSCGTDGSTRMATMQWDKTLARLARNNAKKCTMHHSECLNTPEFKFAGQNCGYMCGSDDYMDDKEVVRKVFSMWVGEYKQATSESIVTNPEVVG